MFDTIITAILPHLLEAFGIIVLTIIAWAAREFARLSGVQIEEKHQRTLHSAIMTGIRMALDLDGKITSTEAINQAVDYAQTAGAPDAIRALGVDQETLGALARSKLNEFGRPG